MAKPSLHKKGPLFKSNTVLLIDRITQHEFWQHNDFGHAPKQLLLFTHVLLQRT